MLGNIELTYNTDEGALTLGEMAEIIKFLATWISKQKHKLTRESYFLCYRRTRSPFTSTTTT